MYNLVTSNASNNVQFSNASNNVQFSNASNTLSQRKLTGDNPAKNIENRGFQATETDWGQSSKEH